MSRNRPEHSLSENTDTELMTEVRAGHAPRPWARSSNAITENSTGSACG